MSSRNMLDSVFTLATLPTPIDRKDGRIQASTVHTLTQSRKRKRAEMAVSIDGEGINIYSVESSRLISSYAVPPQTYFTAPPCSVYQRTGKQRARYTYGAFKESKDEAKNQILCLEEKIQQANPKNTKHIQQKLSSASPVVSIFTLPSHNVTEEDLEAHDVLVISQNGTADCLSSGLENSIWTTTLKPVPQVAGNDAEDLHIEYAQLTDVDTAKKGLLRGREDVLALLQPAEGASDLVDAIQLLFLISRSFSDDSRSVHIFALKSRTSKNDTTQSLPLALLTSVLPRSGSISQSPGFSLHAASGALERLEGGIITTYDFTGISPRVASVQNNTDDPLHSFIRLSPSLLLTASTDRYAVVDVKYNSIQASMSIAASSGTTGRKRRSSDLDTSAGPLIFIDYFPKSNKSIGLCDNRLIVIEVGSEATTSKRRKLDSTLLIDSIGKGTGPAAVGTRKKKAKMGPPCLGYLLDDSAVLKRHDAWSEVAEALDQLAAQKDDLEFEAKFAEFLKIDTNVKRARKGKNRGKLDWYFPESAKPLPVFREQALYALAHIFGFDPPTEASSPISPFSARSSSVSITFYCPNIIKWLIITGQLTTDLVQQALQKTSKTDQTVSRGDMIAAIAKYDPSLELLHIVLNNTARLDIEEVVQAIKIIIQSLDDHTLPQPDPKLVADANPDRSEARIVQARITNGHSRSDSGATKIDKKDIKLLTNGHVPSLSPQADTMEDSEINDLDMDLDRAISTLENGIPIRGESLRQALTKLSSFPSAAITQTLRRNLTYHEIVFLIHILRIELADGGWTARYMDKGPDTLLTEDSGEPSNRAINVIANILSCSVDALGMSGWLISTATDPLDSIDALLDSLRTEISATLEGVHEATFLTGVLTEFLRYPYKRRKAGLSIKPKRANAGAHDVLSQGKVWRVQKDAEPQLPLGLSLRTGEFEMVDKVVVKGGGEGLHRRTKKEQARAIYKGIGKYSFEKIRI